MAVLVTGASGFLGGRLARVLADRGEAVRILVRSPPDLPFEAVHGSLGDRDSLARAVRGVTRIYHCAACSTDWAPWPTYFESNVIGVANLLEAARTAEIERFLHVSTTDVYGYPAEPCDESHALRDTGLPYNRSKCLGEDRVWEAARQGLPVTVVRPATIYGPRGKAFALDIANLIQRGSMAVIDGGRAPGGFCYVDNAVEAIIRAAESPATEGRAYNLCDGGGETWRTYVDALADGLRARRPWLNLPFAAAFPLARMLEAAPGRPLLTRHAVYLLSRNQEFPTNRARSEFGFSPAVSFQEGVARTVEWLRVIGSKR